MLLAALVITGALWFNEFEQSRAVNRELQAIKPKLAEFSAIMDAEAKLRKNPKEGPVRLVLTDFGQPRLQWNMELKVLDDSPESPPAAHDAAESGEAK